MPNEQFSYLDAMRLVYATPVPGTPMPTEGYTLFSSGGLHVIAEMVEKAPYPRVVTPHFGTYDVFIPGSVQSIGVTPDPLFENITPSGTPRRGRVLLRGDCLFAAVTGNAFLKLHDIRTKGSAEHGGQLVAQTARQTLLLAENANARIFGELGGVGVVTDSTLRVGSMGPESHIVLDGGKVLVEGSGSSVTVRRGIATVKGDLFIGNVEDPHGQIFAKKVKNKFGILDNIHETG